MTASATVRGNLRGLALSCHPLPTVAVTLLATGLAVLAGNSVGTTALVAAAVLAGQLSIGWSNDWIDARRDGEHGRTDKPAAVGAVPVSTVRLAALVALAAAGALSLLLGWRAGLAAVLLVFCGWTYNLRLKATRSSATIYAIGFGSLPAVATLALPDHPAPATWALLAAALLGVGAHFANVLPDIEDDIADGVMGLPQRLGPRGAATVAPLLFVAAAAAVVLGPPGPPAVWQWFALAAISAACTVGAVLGFRNPASRWMFRAVIVGAVAEVLLVSLSDAALY